MENALASIDTNLSHSMSFTKKENAINPKAKCPAIVAILIINHPRVLKVYCHFLDY